MRTCPKISLIIILILTVALILKYYRTDPTDSSISIKENNIQTLEAKSNSIINQVEKAHYSPLSLEVISGVKKFVVFIGYFRSGHSIVGSLLDAHPNVVVAHELNVLRWLSRLDLQNSEVKADLFNELYANSFNNVFSDGKRSDNNKGYNLTIENSWQGRYRERIDVIGDKNGGGTSRMYRDNAKDFKLAYNRLHQFASIPIRFIHCVRNPFDVISTMVLYRIQSTRIQKDLVPISRKSRHVYKDVQQLSSAADLFFSLADSVANISQSITSGDRLLEIHNHELVSHPEDTVFKLCQFLNIDCPRDYLKLCAAKVFPKISRSRFTVDWPEEMKKIVQSRLELYPFFKGYSFESLM
ncbi:uncharacterized protein LOC135335748 [Halichondria panicea]|uniref:uncharacterized protein LOC135335748 n=1 Tax=Halichondria panicea TaxID=6063 RepID=UPI00312B7B0F